MLNTRLRPVMRKMRRMRSCVADQVDPAVVRADPLEAADQHAKAGRIEELDRLHVHDQLVAAGLGRG